MKLIVGLGNPGSRYFTTRHNIGQQLVLAAAEKFSARFKNQKKLQASVAPVTFDSHEVLLAYPETFMNVSGETVSLLVRHFEIRPSADLLVIVDDIAIPFGTFRLRSKGSAGGHNGLKSIQSELATINYPRLRVGVGSSVIDEKRAPLEDFVLSEFDRAEKKGLPEILEKGIHACKLWVSQPISAAMNIVNASN